MNYKTYKKILVLVFALLGVFSLFGEYVANQSSQIYLINYIVIRCLMIFLFFFSIYAYLKKVEGTRMLEKPAVFVIIGTTFVIFSVLYPIARYYLLPEPTNAPITALKDQGMDSAVMPAKRFSFAKKYYLRTGQSISYLNDNNAETMYLPDDKTVEMRDREVKYQQQLQDMRNNARPISIILSLVFVVALAGFFVLLRNNSNRGRAT